MGPHQLLAFANDVNLLGDNIDQIKKNTETLIDASKEVGLEINIEKTKNMLLSCHQNAGQNQDLIRQEIRKRLNSGNACYHLVLNLLSSWVQSKNVKIIIFKTIILPVVLYGCKNGL
jgi:hypothetical protein